MFSRRCQVAVLPDSRLEAAFQSEDSSRAANGAGAHTGCCCRRWRWFRAEVPENPNRIALKATKPSRTTPTRRRTPIGHLYTTTAAAAAAAAARYSRHTCVMLMTPLLPPPRRHHEPPPGAVATSIDHLLFISVIRSLPHLHRRRRHP